eukprot:gene5399-7483_t
MLLIVVLIICISSTFGLLFHGARLASPVRTTGSALSAVKLVYNEEEPIENVLKRFKRSVNQSGHLLDLRYKEHWETAAEKRKRKREKARLLNRIERTNDKYEKKAEGGNEYSS